LAYQSCARVVRYAGIGVAVASLAFTASATAASGGASMSGGASASARSVSLSGDSKHMGDRVLRQGMKGHDVRVLQDYLTLAGFPTRIDGSFAASTKRNLIKFQRSAGLTPNGVLTYAGNKALRAAVAAANSSTTAGGRAVLHSNGLASAPANAPASIKAAIAAGNRIAHTPYIWGGGHASFNARGYDCSGSVSYALHAAHLLSAPEVSGSFESYGSPGAGHWITLWANSGHVYMQIAGLYFDTGAQSSSNGNDRWSTRRASPAGGFVIRHPSGL
jgi:peptidoglycan hydrolase-like protein with peptidoglycan-binding domain